jgi:hypothetical protein
VKNVGKAKVVEPVSYYLFFVSFAKNFVSYWKMSLKKSELLYLPLTQTDNFYKIVLM